MFSTADDAILGEFLISDALLGAPFFYGLITVKRDFNTHLFMAVYLLNLIKIADPFQDCDYLLMDSV
ncbi:MAG TPA: hypothetical protein PLE32_09980 [Haliscomenobacter sp.]|nr:hypothetical protein [Haliscomenobacter sp.]